MVEESTLYNQQKKTVHVSCVEHKHFNVCVLHKNNFSKQSNNKLRDRPLGIQAEFEDNIEAKIISKLNSR